jgi:hypothetical protein
MSGIISSFAKFTETYSSSGILQSNPGRVAALKAYFENGGVISIEGKAENGKWPRLVYPNKIKLNQEIGNLQEFRSNFSKNKSNWKSTLNDAKTYHTKHNILKLTHPLYWKHFSKKLTDKEYNEASEKVKLPAHLVNDPRWQPMIKTFLNDPEYRQQLTETVDNSIVYKSDKRVAKYADTLNDLRSEVSTKKIASLDKKLGEIDKKLETLQAMQKWANE